MLNEKIQLIEQRMNRKKCRYILMLYVIIPLAYSTAHCVYNLILRTIGLNNELSLSSPLFHVLNSCLFIFSGCSNGPTI